MKNVIEYNHFFQIVACNDEFGKRVVIESVGETEWHPRHGLLSCKEKIWEEILDLLFMAGVDYDGGRIFEPNAYRMVIRYDKDAPSELILLGAAKAKWAMRQVGRKKGRLS